MIFTDETYHRSRRTLKTGSLWLARLYPHFYSSFTYPPLHHPCEKLMNLFRVTLTCIMWEVRSFQQIASGSFYYTVSRQIYVDDHGLFLGRGGRSGSVLECLTQDRGAAGSSLTGLTVSLSKNINPSLVLVQPRKTRPFITEKLWMGREE